MKRQLHEAKANLDLAIVKSLDNAPLTFTELQELSDLGVRDLMSDHDLDYVLADKVLNHVKHERLRLQSQNQQTPIEGFESDFTSLTRSNPIAQKPLYLSERRLRNLIRQMVTEEMSR
jgi:hypothetical protein